MKPANQSSILIDLGDAFGEWEASEIQSGVTPRLGLWRLAFKSIFNNIRTCEQGHNCDHQSVTMARYYILSNIRRNQGDLYTMRDHLGKGVLYGNHLALLKHRGTGE